MNEQQQRYTELNGNPVHMPFLESIACLPEYKAAGLTALFNLCVTAANAGPDNMMMSAAGSLAGLAVAKGVSDFFDWMMLRLWFGKNFRELAVDKKPDEKTPPTSPSHLRAAKSIREPSALLSFITGNKLLLVGTWGLSSAFGAVAFPDAATASQFQFGTGFLGTIAGFAGVHFGVAALRYHRGYKQSWAITDLPKPVAKKQDVQVNAGVLNPVASPH